MKKRLIFASITFTAFIAINFASPYNRNVGETAIFSNFTKNDQIFLMFPEISYSTMDCPIEDGVIKYEGSCAILLSNSPCGIDQWLIINELGVPQCVHRPCPMEELPHNGVCVKISDESICGISQILYVEFTGETYCDCIPDFIYDSKISTCVAEHRQGSCPSGMVLELKGRQVTCVKNNCPTDDQIYNSKDGQCYNKTFEGTCLKTGYEIEFNSVKKVAVCVALTPRSFLEVPKLKWCPEGSKKDDSNQCSSVTKLNESSSKRWHNYIVRVPSMITFNNKIHCPKSYKRLPTGVCKSKNRLFG